MGHSAARLRQGVGLCSAWYSRSRRLPRRHGTGANFATVNHLLINALVLEAFQEVLPGARGQLVYFISHNIARKEVVGNGLAWVHRKGATRAFPPGITHFARRLSPTQAIRSCCRAIRRPDRL